MYCWTCGSLMSGGYCPGCGRRISQKRDEASAPGGDINWYVVLGRIAVILATAIYLLSIHPIHH